MTLQEFPVVRKVALVAEILGAPLTIAHHIEPQIPMPVPVSLAMDGSVFLPVVSDEELEHLRQKKIEPGRHSRRNR